MNTGGPASADAADAGPTRSQGTNAPGASALIRARNQLISLNALGKRLDAPALRASLVDLNELWLHTTCTDLGIVESSDYALVAVGGLGRGEMLPYSDLDLVLLHHPSKASEVGDFADKLWYPLWDANVKLDHSVRTIAQARNVAATDLNAALGLLEARHIAGNVEMSQELLVGARHDWRVGVRKRFDELVDSCESRWLRSGDVAHRAEPDVKNGRGGLRDAHILDALAVAQLTDAVPPLGAEAPGGGIAEARRRLLDIRTELHVVAGRARDQLRAQDADEIAAALGIEDRFDLARLISESARTISYSVDVGLRTAMAALPKKGLSRLRRAPSRRPLAEGVVEQGGEVTLARAVAPGRDPGLVVRIAAAAASVDLPISASALNRLAEHAPELRTPWPREALDDLIVLLSSGSAMVPIIEALDRTGLWGRLLPEWGAIRDLPPRDAIHTWTVDRHLVETAAGASRFATRVSRPDLLALGALIHDIGKGRAGDHSVVGASLAVQICRRLGLAERDVEVVRKMVRHHLLLPDIAMRRDISDPDTVQRVLDAVDGDLVVLELLRALAQADSLATGPGVWNDWKASLIDDLLARCRALGSGAPLPEADPVDPALVEKAATGGVFVDISPTDDAHRFTVVTIAPDQPGLLSDAAGVMNLASLRVLSASVGAYAGSAINTFTVSPRFGTPAAPVLLRQEFIRALRGDIDVIALLDIKEREVLATAPLRIGREGVPTAASAPPTLLRWIDAGGQLLLEVRTPDRFGLLARIAKVLEDFGADIRWAKLSTMGSVVLDTFCVDLADCDTNERRREIERGLLAVLPSG